MKTLFEGVCVALVTPFKNKRVDYAAIEKLIDRCIAGGISAICVLGTTGESSTITYKEREQIIKKSKDVIDGKCKLIVGCGSNDYIKAKRYIKQAQMLKADGALVVTPYYNKTTQSGIVNYYQKLSTLGLPIIMYNVPSRTGLNIELSTLKKLIKLPNIYGIKESTCDITRIIELCKICKNKIAVYSGEDNLNYLFYCLEGKGCVSVTANALPKDVAEVYNYAKEKNMPCALAKQNYLDNLNYMLFCETNPIPIKCLLNIMGYIKNEVRLPLITMSKKAKEKLKKLYTKKYKV